MKDLSKSLFERAVKVAPGGVHSPVRGYQSVGGTPFFFKEGKGAYLTSVEGDRYLDFCQSFGPLMLGHRDPDVHEAVIKTLEKIWTVGACEPYSLELAEWITAKVPFVEKLRFVNSGTEAVMSALRVARAATGREKVLKFEGCYHGHVDSLLVKSGSGLAESTGASSSAGVGKVVAEQTFVWPLDKMDGLEEFFHTKGKELAAVILEPLPANYGLLPQRKEFWDKVFDLAKKQGALIIFDEVITGFRVAPKGMAEVLGVTPDLVTYGKVIGGGFPIGCYGGREDLMNLVAPLGPVYQAGTLSGNPIGMMAGLTTLKKMEEINIWDLLEKRGKRFAQKLNTEFETQGLKARMRQIGSLFWMMPIDDFGCAPRAVSHIPPTLKDWFSKYFHECLKNSIYFAPNGFEVGFLGLGHTDEILDQAAETLVGIVKNIQQ